MLSTQINKIYSNTWKLLNILSAVRQKVSFNLETTPETILVTPKTHYKNITSPVSHDMINLNDLFAFLAPDLF